MSGFNKIKDESNNVEDLFSEKLNKVMEFRRSTLKKTHKAPTKTSRFSNSMLVQSNNNLIIDFKTDNQNQLILKESQIGGQKSGNSESLNAQN